VVVHTHGVFGSKPGGRGKRFVNVWHGMPVKLLEQSSIVGRNQTDVTIATSPLHAEHLAETWGLRSDQVAVTGLPRNDLLAGPPPLRPQWLAEVLGERKLVMWLPTFRTGVRRVARAEGVDTGTDTQFEGADAAAVDRLMAELGAHCIVKAHPMAPQPERQDLPNLTILGASHLEELGTTLYELLAHADVLVTDHSSVWIDFLLTGRPMVFTISDREQYAADRGYYFDDLDSLLPGPIVTSFDELAEPLADALAGAAGWKAAREDALALHHVHTDDRSAERVADLIEAQLRT
jgi:CDP-glycerol glycerophosphotransferase